MVSAFVAEGGMLRESRGRHGAYPSRPLLDDASRVSRGRLRRSTGGGRAARTASAGVEIAREETSRSAGGQHSIVENGQSERAGRPCAVRMMVVAEKAASNTFDFGRSFNRPSTTAIGGEYT